MTPVSNKTKTTVAAQPSTHVTEQPTPVIDLSGIQFARPKTVKGKSTRPTCNHVYSDGSKCQLRVMEGETEFCVNHVPAERKLTEQEATVLAGWLATLTPAELLVAHVRALGWYKAKQQAKELETVTQ